MGKCSDSLFRLQPSKRGAKFERKWDEIKQDPCSTAQFRHLYIQTLFKRKWGMGAISYWLVNKNRPRYGAYCTYNCFNLLNVELMPGQA